MWAYIQSKQNQYFKVLFTPTFHHSITDKRQGTEQPTVVYNERIGLQRRRVIERIHEVLTSLEEGGNLTICCSIDES